ncbi:MAG TPA: response regulator transcription factor [Candidatus Baltobacteraceae bacterium]|jgi:DNA-binding response OmpR family regulator|nr:response regulator transcription factor [Candidatus Baltobacteraceae bacterium]
MARLLVVEDDEPLRELLRRGLVEDGHVVDALPDGRDCEAFLADAAYDVMLLDLNLPHEDGLTILRRLRSGGDATPVLILTARDDARDVVAGLDSGADDYLRKPFTFDELEARLRSLVRRPRTWAGNVLRSGDVTFDRVTRHTRRGDREIPLTAKESIFLEALMSTPGRVVTRRALEDRLWNREADPSSNVLDVYARRLRNKLTIDGERQLIETVRGLGFRLAADE